MKTAPPYPIVSLFEDLDNHTRTLNYLLSCFLLSSEYLNTKSLYVQFGIQEKNQSVRDFFLTFDEKTTKTELAEVLENSLTESYFQALKSAGNRLFFKVAADNTFSANNLLVIDFANGNVRLDLGSIGLKPEYLPYFLDSMETIAIQEFDCLMNLKLVSPSQLKFINDNLLGEQIPKKNSLPLNTRLADACALYQSNIAYVYKDSNLSCQELDEHSSFYAKVLLEKGVKKGDLVFILMKNGLEIPVAYVACMKVGAVPIPVALDWPEKRLKLLENKFSPKAIFATSEIDFLTSNCILLKLEEDKKDSVAPTVEIKEQDLAYGFFTSGSTGHPKCTLNRHDGLLNRFDYMSKVFGITQDNACVLQNSSHVFDSSLWQLFWPILHGVTVIIPEQKPFLNLDYTLNLIEKFGVTMTDLVPSIFNLLVDKIRVHPALKQKLKSVKILVVGGEESSASYIKEFKGWFPDIQLVNTYGHTEASIGMVFDFLAPKEGDSIVPLGSPIDNTFVTVADEYHRVKPVGAKGMIYVGGVCIGDGYLGEKEKNEATFYKNPFPFISGKRIFRTGDVGFLRADGKLCYVGRDDDQIKIGGIRLDLKEVETVIEEYPMVSQAKVLYLHKSKSLTAFIKSDKQLDKKKIINFLRQRVPKHAVPATITILKKYPLNQNGKIDRKALLAGSFKAKTEERPLLNLDKLEQYLVNNWKELLNIPHLATHENFLELGGNSLSVLKMILGVEANFNVKLDLHKVYNNLTIDNIKKVVKEQRKGIDNENDSQQASKSFFPLILNDYTMLVNKISTLNIPALPETVNSVFLTGATGFFGAMLLSNILTNTPYTVHCLVRSKSPEHGMKRIETELEPYFNNGLKKHYRERIKVICGDLSKPNLGIDEATFLNLAAEIDVILHNGAAVDFVQDYEGIRKTNVLSIQYILKLAAKLKLKPIHFISSISIVSETFKDYFNQIPEKILYDFNYLPKSGYDQGKWLIEHFLNYAQKEKKIPISIYRFGEIEPDDRVGTPNEKSLLHFFIKAIHYTNLAPDSDHKLDLMPGNIASDFVVSNLPDLSLGKSFNVMGKKVISINEMTDHLKKSNPAIRKVDYLTFREGVKSLCGDDMAFMSALYFVLPREKLSVDPMKEVFFDKVQNVSNHGFLNFAAKKETSPGISAYLDKPFFKL